MQSKQYPNLLDALPEVERNNISTIHRILRGAGYDCFLVGGAVRDLLLGRTAGDLDIATNAHPAQVRDLFKRTIPTGIQHGTITVMMRGMPFEVTTYRAESTYSDARRPDSVSFSETLSEDLERRDFTVNALAFEPGEKYLVDEHRGLADLDVRVIRTIGEARDRFFEDGLRPVRACRFCATLEFTLDGGVEEALARPDVQERSQHVARERFADELWKGFRARAISRMLKPLESSGLADIFLPGEFRDRNPLTSENERSLDEFFPAAAEARMAGWWRMIGIRKESWKGAAQELKFSGRANKTISLYGKLLDFLEDPEIRAMQAGSVLDGRARLFLSEVKRNLGDESAEFLGGVPEEIHTVPGGLAYLVELLRRDPLTLGDLNINGSDLKELGLKGTRIGETLQRLLRLTLENPQLNHRKELMKLIELE